MKKIDCHGKVFGYWLAESEAQRNKAGLCMWNCVCICGVRKTLAGHLLSSGKTKSCGCKKGEMVRRVTSTHGLTKTPEFSTWTAMKDRCTNENSKDYARYGAIGIAICDEWLMKFETFLADMGPRPNGTSIERIDNALGYSKNNCVWAYPKQQNRNRRSVVFFKGKTQTEWAEELGVSIQAISYRMKKFNSPLGKQNASK